MRPYITAEEAAVILGVSINTVYNYRRDGLLRQEMVGRKKRFVTAQVQALKTELLAGGVVKETNKSEVITTQ